MQHVTLRFLRSVSARPCFTLDGGKFEGSLVEGLNPFCLHCDVCFLKAVLLQQIFHLQKMLPIIFRQQLDLTRSRNGNKCETSQVEEDILHDICI